MNYNHRDKKMECDCFDGQQITQHDRLYPLWARNGSEVKFAVSFFTVLKLFHFKITFTITAREIILYCTCCRWAQGRVMQFAKCCLLQFVLVYSLCLLLLLLILYQ